MACMVRTCRYWLLQEFVAMFDTGIGVNADDLCHWISLGRNPVESEEGEC